MAKVFKPVNTRYRGTQFRSRLEARWAAFFDLASVTWEYEPDRLPGTGWWPDFRVSGVYLLGERVGLMAEVKPVPLAPKVVDPSFAKAIREEWTMLLGFGPRDGLMGMAARKVAHEVETVGLAIDSERGIYSTALGAPTSAMATRLWNRAYLEVPAPGVSMAVNRVIERQMGKRLFHFPGDKGVS